MSDTIIPLAVPDMRGNEAVYLARCVEDNWVSSAGPDVETFERRMADIAGVEHAVATVNGTSALYLALRVAGIGLGQSVLVPDFTFAATANAVLAAGGVPYFVDIDPETWTLDPTLVSEILAEDASISAVVAVHVLGHPADMDRLADVCSRHGVPLFEDAAGAIGARYKGRPAGSLGDGAIFSFNGNKTVTAGGGGMLVTNNGAWADRARLLSTQARDGAAYRYVDAGFNYRMPNINAALGLAQLERLAEMLAAKRAIAARYDVALDGRADLTAMPRAGWADSGCWLYSVRCSMREEAAALVRHMAERNIGARVFWEILSDQPPYRDASRKLTGVAAALSGTVVSLPCSSQLTVAEQGRVIAALAAWRGADSVASA
ncbi:MAG TPA: aminotransferase class I/II-fold pyridoxal phosphate-dependent enzyme [Methyloceanibacter sp.]|nr:aminotransferase class I/II-fold pyridoxal phosphate-dependent enzyme [Methyloceanibacter sp.]